VSGPAPGIARVREDRVLRLLVEGTAAATGPEFFRSLVQSLAGALQTSGAWITEYLPARRRLRALAFWYDGRFIDEYEYAIEGTPCQRVIDGRTRAHFPENIVALFPDDPDLTRFQVVSYLGVPLLDTDDTLLGHLAVLDRRPMPQEPSLLPVFDLFATRAAAEYRRLRSEERVATREEELTCLREQLHEGSGPGGLIGRSAPMRELLDSLARVAATDATVLILGETGTGKELVARSIHEAGPRRGRALVRVNCAALPATLIESELFGHEKGAFTGATARREGRFALADGGTIFLDEVGELPLEAQAKLLRVLQEGELEPLGGTATRKVDVRVIAATNRDLAAMVRAGTFREDLFYRLDVFPLRVPPLRERGEDVALLAAAFVERFARRMGRRVEALAPAELERLRRHPWPGNVRELQNVVERALILSSGPRIGLAGALPGAVPAAPPAAPAAGEAGPRILSAAEMAAAERANLLRALEAAGWKIAGPDGAARLLGLAPSTLSSRMKALGLRRERPEG
jgi:transcriptional regulator with GAF, ATPase, and Fis domain